ncbi:hypothetical protein N7501_011365 [Penicillium viridicatum]|nr:hypothetical protein N7501_011365 [Penicillium viridicatum]
MAVAEEMAENSASAKLWQNSVLHPIWKAVTKFSETGTFRQTTDGRTSPTAYYNRPSGDSANPTTHQAFAMAGFGSISGCHQHPVHVLLSASQAFSLGKLCATDFNHSYKALV